MELMNALPHFFLLSWLPFRCVVKVCKYWSWYAGYYSHYVHEWIVCLWNNSGKFLVVSPVHTKLNSCEELHHEYIAFIIWEHSKCFTDPWKIFKSTGIITPFTALLAEDNGNYDKWSASEICKDSIGNRYCSIFLFLRRTLILFYVSFDWEFRLY